MDSAEPPQPPPSVSGDSEPTQQPESGLGAICLPVHTQPPPLGTAKQTRTECDNTGTFIAPTHPDITSSSQVFHPNEGDHHENLQHALKFVHEQGVTGATVESEQTGEESSLGYQNEIQGARALLQSEPSPLPQRAPTPFFSIAALTAHQTPSPQPDQPVPTETNDGHAHLPPPPLLPPSAMHGGNLSVENQAGFVKTRPLPHTNTSLLSLSGANTDPPYGNDGRGSPSQPGQDLANPRESQTSSSNTVSGTGYTHSSNSNLSDPNGSGSGKPTQQPARFVVDPGVFSDEGSILTTASIYGSITSLARTDLPPRSPAGRDLGGEARAWSTSPFPVPHSASSFRLDSLGVDGNLKSEIPVYEGGGVATREREGAALFMAKNMQPDSEFGDVAQEILQPNAVTQRSIVHGTSFPSETPPQNDTDPGLIGTKRLGGVHEYYSEIPVQTPQLSQLGHRGPVMYEATTDGSLEGDDVKTQLGQRHSSNLHGSEQTGVYGTETEKSQLGVRHSANLRGDQPAGLFGAGPRGVLSEIIGDGGEAASDRVDQMLARIMQQQTDIPPRDLEESIRRLSYETGGVGGRRENSQQQPAQVGGLGGDNGGFGLQNEQELLGLVASLEGHLTSMVNTQLDVPAQANRASRFPAPTGVPPSMMPNLATSRGPVAQSDEADWASVLLAEAGIATAAAIPAMARPAQDAAVIPPNVMDIPRNSGSLPDGVEKYPARQSAPASYSPSQLIRDDTHTAQAASLPSSHPMVPIVDPLRLRDNTRDLQPPTVVSAAEKIPAALPANEPKIESRERVVVAERTGDVGTKIGGAELGVGGPTVLVNSETEVSINNDVSIMSVDDGDASSVGVETGPPRLRTMGEVLEATNYSRCYFRHGLESVEEKLVSEGNKGDTLIGVAVPDAKYFRTLGEVKAMEVAGRCNADLLSQRRCRYPFYNIDEDLWNVAVPGPWNPPGGRAEDLTATDEGNRKRGRPGQVYVLEGAPKRPCKDKRDLCDSLLPRELPRNFVSRRPCRNTVQPPVVKSLQKGRSKRQQQPRENAPITPTDGLTAYLRARDERRAIALAWNPPHQPPLGFLRPISNTEREKERFSPPTSPHMPLPPPSQRTSRADNAFPTHMAQSKPTSIPSLSGPTPVRAPTHQPQPHQPPMPNLRGLPGPEHEGPRGHELDEITQKPRLAYPPPVTMPRDDGRGEGGFFKDPRSQGAKHFSDFEATRSPHTAPKGNPPPRADYPNDRDAGRDKPRNFKGPTPMDMDRPRMPPAVMDGVFKCAECAVAFRTPDQVEEHVRAAHSRPLPQRNDPSSAPAPRPRGSPMIGRRDSDRDLPPGWQVPPPVSTRHPSPQPPPTQRPPPPQAEMTPMQRAQHTMANVGSGSDGDVHKWRAGHRGPRKDGVPIDQKPRKPKPTLQVKPAPPPKPSSKPGPKGKRVGRKLSLSQICSFCTAEKYLPSGESEMLIHCSTCDRAGHPSCLQFESQALIDTVLSYPWQCLDCKPCSICRSIQDEDNMLCCDKCDRGYHLYCLVPKLDQPPEGDWVCPLCNGRPLPKHRNRAGDSDDDQPLIQAARPPPTTTSADNLIAPYHEG